MASTACFVIVSRNDIPIYEAEVGSALKKEEAAHQHQFILHAALDIVQDLAWTTSAMFLKAMDRFSDLVVSVYVTAGHTRLMLLHDSRNEDGIKSFFQEVHELYIKRQHIYDLFSKQLVEMNRSICMVDQLVELHPYSGSSPPPIGMVDALLVYHNLCNVFMLYFHK
ncbi:trafficking protein particle complex subunit 2 isoform X2 [Amborella trichopoda]|nr:trafficking protein particle complex subunit 2 isoform X2 [Amborella trichopoda]XP_020522089.1 trafficking protein particle complex subunit 2 isoform X2 [Amborella trichopoda]|eukprot:XP_011622873.1 trafficking protein particle complex subunit 2 isoform X2 [Amborella trichopoda]